LLPLLADTDAVGVPPAILRKPNFALLVAVDPRSRSSVMFLSKIEPLAVFSLNGEPPLATGRTPVI